MSKSPLFFHQCRERSLVSFLLFLLYPVSCLLSPVFCLLSPISCLLSPVSRLPVSSLLSLFSRLSVFLLLSPVSCLLSLFSCLSSCCFLSTVSRLQRCKCCRFSGVSDFMEQISGLGQFSDLNALSGLSGLEANYF